MKTLQQIKNDLANGQGYPDWLSSMLNMGTMPLDSLYNNVAKAYAEQFKPKWINLKDTPPENGGYYLFHGKGGRNFTGLFEDGEVKCYCYIYESLEVAEEVTHWMPLPATPKQLLHETI